MECKATDLEYSHSSNTLYSRLESRPKIGVMWRAPMHLIYTTRNTLPTLLRLDFTCSLHFYLFGTTFEQGHCSPRVGTRRWTSTLVTYSNSNNMMSAWYVHSAFKNFKRNNKRTGGHSLVVFSFVPSVFAPFDLVYRVLDWGVCVRFNLGMWFVPPNACSLAWTALRAWPLTAATNTILHVLYDCVYSILFV